MATLTERRFDRAQGILDKYRDQLHSAGRIEVGQFERELKDCWNLGYQELKDIIIDLAKRDHYRYLAAYYMERSNAPGVVSEFQGPLAKLYGIDHYYAEDREKLRNEFWQGMDGVTPPDRR